ncbi:hypothetical protein SynA1825c_00888 [Synechococcus sp. A18-25c]|nr:hypothetical protein SynA1825c_00888 [Synechococcus sp. A18-25c]
MAWSRGNASAIRALIEVLACFFGDMTAHRRAHFAEVAGFVSG